MRHDYNVYSAILYISLGIMGEINFSVRQGRQGHYTVCCIKREGSGLKNTRIEVTRSHIFCTRDNMHEGPTEKTRMGVLSHDEIKVIPFHFDGIVSKVKDTLIFSELFHDLFITMYFCADANFPKCTVLADCCINISDWGIWCKKKSPI